jgi:hypothetical protein
MRMYSIAWQNCSSFSKRLSFFHSAITYENYLGLALKFGLLYLDRLPLPSFVPVTSYSSCDLTVAVAKKKKHIKLLLGFASIINKEMSPY